VADTLELQWDPEPGDWADGLRAIVPLYRFAPVFAAVFAVVGIVLLTADQPVAGAFGLACAVIIAGFPLVAVWASFHRNPVAGTTVTAKADEQSLRMMTIDGTAYSDVDWTTLTGWRETRRGFVLRTGGRSFYPVPNRAFSKPEQRQRFQDLLQRRISQN
jgi:YcxB-like protein